MMVPVIILALCVVAYIGYLCGWQDGRSISHKRHGRLEMTIGPITTKEK